jgi:hypothetical protein
MRSEVQIGIGVAVDGVEQRWHSLCITGEAADREAMLAGALAIVEAVCEAVERISAGESTAIH